MAWRFKIGVSSVVAAGWVSAGGNEEETNVLVGVLDLGSDVAIGSRVAGMY
ncbi:hypothetical protein L484_023356 [Morus notabilis]|uniref:Uncharacterized protein n=1 Tax=Morus notabilis TaxID=981085 RepID=W9SG07_9ROSA|nr:hypothetical protein L484_023356 [Morus notabilis]